MKVTSSALRKTESDRLTLDIERWLSGDSSVNLAPDMYIGDLDDYRWTKGHSSHNYYVKRDEQATFNIVKNNLHINVDNIFDMGVGGKQAVRDVGLSLAKIVCAKNYFGFDLATILAENAAEQALSEGLNAAPVICDIFEKLPFKKQNTLIALLGLTLGNIETYDNPKDVQNRFRDIFTHYANSVIFPDYKPRPPNKRNHLLISYDANRNIQEVKNCYLNQEFGNLVRSCIDKAIDTNNFDFDVVLRETPEVLFLATGLRSKRDQIINFNDKEFAVEKDQFLPVLNSSRFSIPFMTEAAIQAGWVPANIWSATGRVQYQHFVID